MKRPLIAVLVLALLLPGGVWAQGDLTETYSANGITFNYPSGWFTQADENGEVKLSNMEFGKDDSLFDIQAGQVIINFANWSTVASGGRLSILEDDPKFRAGFVTATTWFLTAFSVAFNMPDPSMEEQMVIGEMEEISLADNTAYLVPIQVTAATNIELQVLSSESGLFATSHAPAGEMEQWRDLILAIAETVQFSETAVEQPESSVTGTY